MQKQLYAFFKLIANEINYFLNLMNNNYFIKIKLLIIFLLLNFNTHFSTNNIRNIINSYNRYKRFYDYKFNYKSYYNYNYTFTNKWDNINNKQSFNLSVAICVIAKEENLYIKEFVDYYKELGVKKIFLYDNNDLNGENFNEILKSEIINCFIEIINYRGLKSPQFKAYNECYTKNNQKFDWIGFYDVDEFLYIKKKIILINF